MSEDVLNNNVCKNLSPYALNESRRKGKARPHGKLTDTVDTYAQNAKKAPAAIRTPTTVAPTPVTLRAPLPLPLKEPEGTAVDEEEPEDVPVERVDTGVMVEPRPEEVEEGGRVEMEVPDPELEGSEEEVEERGAPTSNWAVWESTVFTSPTGEAWKVYPEPSWTVGRVRVMVPSEVWTVFANANVLRKASLVR